MQIHKNFYKYSYLFIVSIFTFSTVFIFNGCDSEDTITPPTAVLPLLMVTHASPNAPNVDVLINNDIEYSNVAYGTSSEYKSLPSGNERVRFNVTGTSVSVIDTTTFYQEGRSYSIFAIDSVNSITPLIFADDLTAPGTSNSNVRFIHLSPNSPNVDLAVTGGNILFPNYAFKEFSSFRALTAGTYNLEVRLANQMVVILALPNITFTAGKIYTIYLKGFLAASGTTQLGAGIINNN